MDQFDTVMMKLGEFGLQAILENWERFKGIQPKHTMTLEARWEQFLRATENPSKIAA